jgi:transposase-like protein
MLSGPSRELRSRPVAEVADSLGVSDQTIYNLRNQDRIDRGLRPGAAKQESVELAKARRRIRELETELAVVRRANELLKDRTDPKRRWEVASQIVSELHMSNADVVRDPASEW